LAEKINPETNGAQQQARKNYQPPHALLKLPLFARPGYVGFVPVIVFPLSHSVSSVAKPYSAWAW
jgi:hypothetical protein